MKRDELLNWMPHIEAEFDRRGLDTYAMLVSRATEMLQRDEETIAALEAERDQLRAEYAAYGVDMGRALDEVSRLRAELAECRLVLKDARSVINPNLSPQHAAWAKKIEDALANSDAARKGEEEQ